MYFSPFISFSALHIGMPVSISVSLCVYLHVHEKAVLYIALVIDLLSPDLVNLYSYNTSGPPTQGWHNSYNKLGPSISGSD